jgi:hypothetical protein
MPLLRSMLSTAGANKQEVKFADRRLANFTYPARAFEAITPREMHVPFATLRRLDIDCAQLGRESGRLRVSIQLVLD